MILTDIGPDAPFYRAFTPRWAHAPESGAGSARVGGRFNRPGVEARYLALGPETALDEYQGESPLLPPATVVTFLVTAKQVVDFSAGYDSAHWTPIWAEACGNWKGLAFLEGVEPPTGVIGDIVRDAGHPGILYRSARSKGGVCLVLFPEAQPRSGFTARTHDPARALPRDDRPWEGGRPVS
jgi:RES domain-containing protein